MADAEPTQQVCTLEGTYHATGGGRGEYSYAIDGSGSCHGPSATITLAGSGGALSTSLVLPTCGEPEIPSSGTELRNEARVTWTVSAPDGVRVDETRWRVREVLGPVSGSAVVYDITGHRTGLAVVTSGVDAAPNCVAGNGAPLTIALALDGPPD